MVSLTDFLTGSLMGFPVYIVFFGIPIFGIETSLFIYFIKDKNRKERFIKTFLIYTIGSLLAIAYVFYFGIVLLLHPHEFQYGAIYVSRDILYSGFIIESSIWFFFAGWRYAKLSFRDLANGEVKSIDKKKLIIGMLISFLWIPLTIAMVAVR